MTELYINEQQIELYDEQLLPSSQISSIADLQNVYSGITKQFKVPKSARNKKALEFLDNVNVMTALPYNENTAKIIMDGFEVYAKGIAVVNSSDDYYNITVKYGNTDFFTQLDQPLSNIDFSELDHRWDDTTIAGTQNNDYTDGYTWPLVDYGQLNGADGFLCRYSLPGIYVAYAIQKIFDEYGYTPVGDFWSSAEYLSELIPLLTRYTSQDVLDNMPVSTSYGAVQGIPSSQLQNVGDVAKIDMTPDVDNYGLFDNDANYIFNPIDGIVDVGIRISTFVYSGSGSLRGKLILIDPNGKRREIIGSTFTGATFGYTDTLQDVEVKAGSRFIAECEVISITSPGFVMTMLMSISTTKYTATETYYGFDYPVTPNLPDISQKELLKAIGQKYGLLFRTNPNAKTLEAVQFQDIIDNRSKSGKYYDWSEKLDLTNENGDIEKIETNYRASSFGQTNKFSFSNDGTISEDYGQGAFDIPDQNLSDEVSFIDFKFGASRIVYRFGINMPFINLYSSFNFNTNTINNRIVEVNKKSGSIDIIGENNYKVTLTTGAGSGALFLVIRVVDTTYLIAYNGSYIQTAIDFFNFYASDLNNKGVLLTYFENSLLFRSAAEGVNFSAPYISSGSDIGGTVTDNSDTTTITTSPLSICTFKDGQEIIEDHYQGYVNTLRYFKKISPKFRLTAGDFTNFNHYYPIYLDRLGWFYCEKINKLNPRGLTTCDLIKIGTVVNDPVASFKTTQPTGYTISFKNESTDAVSYFWNFGDGTTSTDEDPSHTFVSCGDKNVSLTVTNSMRKTDKTTETVYVAELEPKLDFSKCNSQYIPLIT